MELLLIDQDAALKPSKGSLRERDNLYYEILAGGAKIRLLEAFIDLGLPELLGRKSPTDAADAHVNVNDPMRMMSASEIITQLGLHPTRGWKFLHLCSLSQLLIEQEQPPPQEGEGGDSHLTYRYGLSPLAIRFFGDRGLAEDSFYFRDLLAYWRYLDSLPTNLTQVLRGASLPVMPVWPPTTVENAKHLETWMTVTAQGAIDTILSSRVMDHAQRILDVGGGDGTIAIAIVQDALSKGVSPIPHITIFNLQHSADLATEKIARHGFEEYISVQVGDFLTEELAAPTTAASAGYDRVMFSRVLTDWTPPVCKMLLQKAKNALSPGGKIVINEAFNEGNRDYAISWEMRYVYYDTFGRYLFKPAKVYEDILREMGCCVAELHPMLDTAFYSVLVARVEDSSAA